MTRRQAGLLLTCTCCAGDFTAGTATLGRKGFLLTPPGVKQCLACGTSSDTIQAGYHPWVGSRESKSFNSVCMCVCIKIYINEGLKGKAFFFFESFKSNSSSCFGLGYVQGPPYTCP